MALPKILEELDQKRLEDPSETARDLMKLVPTLTDQRELCLALGVFASCKRHLGQITEAIETLDGALPLAVEEWDRAHLLQRRSLAIGATGDFEAAFTDSDQALLGYFRAGDTDRVGRCMANQGMWRFHLEEYERSIVANKAALALLVNENLSSRFSCYQCLALAYFECQDQKSCIINLESARPLAESFGSPAFASFLLTESRLFARLGRNDLAEPTLQKARELLWTTGAIFDAALASVALVECFLTQNKTEKAIGVAIQCRRFLLHLPESSLATPILAALWKQAENRSLSLSFLQAALEKLEGGRRDAPARKN